MKGKKIAYNENISIRQVEALKRELTDDSGSSSRIVLRDRLAEKGPAPSPPVINKTREVDYVGFAKYVVMDIHLSYELPKKKKATRLDFIWIQFFFLNWLDVRDHFPILFLVFPTRCTDEPSKKDLNSPWWLSASRDWASQRSLIPCSWPTFTLRNILAHRIESRRRSKYVPFLSCFLFFFVFFIY